MDHAGIDDALVLVSCLAVVHWNGACDMASTVAHHFPHVLETPLVGDTQSESTWILTHLILAVVLVAGKFRDHAAAADHLAAVVDLVGDRGLPIHSRLLDNLGFSALCSAPDVLTTRIRRYRKEHRRRTKHGEVLAPPPLSLDEVIVALRARFGDDGSGVAEAEPSDQAKGKSKMKSKSRNKKKKKAKKKNKGQRRR
ncbi:uncharacterized protein AMSG_00269 [Thecamonas trahens ATCC 50062]|uniref:Uncharacterized protein n=1 Tax=Thecamonas trahens ATCC 50062 TaxID=461836 RepID=A0A0L0D1R8_THETB|nr:hypothetical protein AMSG_00269 [Thecamonas trahens ATCC 50062]KNC46151.1 hypothetical protein AMSG_00269 [Thecamonas trahens ATCC 50062]|eukprot:XP_013763127.1 hypothetical protein AMSG_00269 [Thecamonas trahens ATCC 50062]